MTTPTTMTAVVQDEVGGPEVLHLATVPRPTPSIGEVLVRVHAAGVNPADTMNRQHGIFSGTPPFTLGWDVSGIIEAVGPGVTLHQPGDEVFGLLPFPRGAGAFAQYVVAPTRALVPKPASLTHVEAAALPLAGLTAWQALVETAGVGPGQRVLVTGASGGVGHLAVQIAHARGAYVIALASGEHAELVTRLGADEVVDYTTTDVATAVHDVDAVLDIFGGDALVAAVALTRPGGIVVTTLPQSLPEVAPVADAAGVRVAGLFVESDRLGLGDLAALADAGQLRPLIAATHPLGEAGVAQSSPHGPGKVVLIVTERLAERT